MTTAFATLAALMILGAEPEADSTIKVNAGKVVNRISPLMYGSCIEDVNHEIYGGLYAQKVFGESFEEPPGGAGLPGWLAYGGEWSAKDGAFSVKADQGAKAVREAPTIADAVVSCEVRLADAKGLNAGLILRVQEPRIGPDAWVGYEISLSARDQKVMLGRHRNDFHVLKEAPATIEPGKWHRLRVELEGAKIRVFVDDDEKPSLSYKDSEPIPSGRVGVRTWESDASFRNLTIKEPACKTAREVALSLIDLGVAGWRLVTPRWRTTVEDNLTPDPDDRTRGLSGAWDLVHTGDADARLTWDAEHPFNGARSQRIEMAGGKGTVGVANRGLNRWGIAVREGLTYEGRCYLRSDSSIKSATVALQSADGSKTYAKATLDEIGKDWAVCGIRLTSDTTDPNARLALWIDKPGSVWVDQVYLSGTGDELFENLPVRGDIARALQKQGLTALRYGGLMVNAPGHKWKTMIGDADKRAPYKGYWYPYTTNGFGIEEFVKFCRAAEFEPIVAINVEETPEDAADLVDYLNGPITTEWGRRRADNGHPEPYAVKYIELGNEEKTDAHYLERFKLLHDAMRPRDPKLSLIIAAWWEPENPITKQIVRELEGKASLWDVHVGGDDPREGKNVDATFTRMEKLVQEWAPGTSLKACVLEENGGRHDLARALGHASVLNATQRHGDFVLIDCPANCLQALGQNDNGWDQGQLFYTPDKVWGMPPYQVQKIASEAHRPCRLASETKSPGDDLDVLATSDERGWRIVLKVVNAGDLPHRTAVRVEGPNSLVPGGLGWTLKGELHDVNSPDGPGKRRPEMFNFKGDLDGFIYEFPAHSYTILKLDAGFPRRPGRRLRPEPKSDTRKD